MVELGLEPGNPAPDPTVLGPMLHCLWKKDGAFSKCTLHWEELGSEVLQGRSKLLWQGADYVLSCSSGGDLCICHFFLREACLQIQCCNRKVCLCFSAPPKLAILKIFFTSPYGVRSSAGMVAKCLGPSLHSIFPYFWSWWSCGEVSPWCWWAGTWQTHSGGSMKGREDSPILSRARMVRNPASLR